MVKYRVDWERGIRQVAALGASRPSDSVDFVLVNRSPLRGLVRNYCKAQFPIFQDVKEEVFPKLLVQTRY